MFSTSLQIVYKGFETTFHKLLQSMFLKTFSQTSVNYVFAKFTNSLQGV